MEATNSKSNFSARELYDAYSKIQTMGYSVVLIGGRAINLLCEMNQRQTHDIDLIIIVPQDEDNNIKRKAIENGFIIPKDQGNKLSKLELIISPSKIMQIDLYYDRPISGIPISYILETSIEIEKSQNKKTYKFRVANPGVLLVLKFFAYNESDNENKDKHGRDIKALLDNYKGVDNFFSKFGDVIEPLFDSQNFELFKRSIINIYRPKEMLRV
jgi:hypothetical protein